MIFVRLGRRIPTALTVVLIFSVVFVLIVCCGGHSVGCSLAIKKYKIEDFLSRSSCGAIALLDADVALISDDSRDENQ